MRKFIAILMSCSLALAASAMAQQDDSQQQQKKKHEQKTHAKPERQAPAKAHASRPAPKPHAAAKANEPARPAMHAEAHAKVQKAEHSQRREVAQKPAMMKPQAKPAPAKAKPKAERQAVQASQANEGNAAQRHNQNPRAAKKPDVKVVQKIKAQHANFHAQARPQQVPSVSFRQNRRISGSEHWQGERYAAFRSYHPERHNEHYYRSRYTHIELIGGGYYYWNSGYWYPAWGYNPSEQYYTYDGPIYTGSVAEPPDRVIANVQAVLQDQGYYKGDVDGLLGPLTREALTGYQSDHGLYTTAAIDQPTLDSLGVGS